MNAPLDISTSHKSMPKDFDDESPVYQSFPSKFFPTKRIPISPSLDSETQTETSTNVALPVFSARRSQQNDPSIALCRKLLEEANVMIMRERSCFDMEDEEDDDDDDESDDEEGGVLIRDSTVYFGDKPDHCKSISPLYTSMSEKLRIMSPSPTQKLYPSEDGTLSTATETCSSQPTTTTTEEPLMEPTWERHSCHEDADDNSECQSPAWISKLRTASEERNPTDDPRNVDQDCEREDVEPLEKSQSRLRVSFAPLPDTHTWSTASFWNNDNRAREKSLFELSNSCEDDDTTIFTDSEADYGDDERSNLALSIEDSRFLRATAYEQLPNVVEKGIKSTNKFFLEKHRAQQLKMMMSQESLLDDDHNCETETKSFWETYSFPNFMGQCIPSGL